MIMPTGMAINTQVSILGKRSIFSWTLIAMSEIRITWMLPLGDELFFEKSGGKEQAEQEQEGKYCGALEQAK